MRVPAYDEIGYWSEVKLDIVREYAQAYSTIIAARQQPPLYHIYIDAFAGSGVHISRVTGNFVAGSPLNALFVRPPFREFHLIDLDKSKADDLRALTAGQRDVTVYQEDCNQVLLERVLPRVRHENYRRALCLLDPWGLDLNWEVTRTAADMKTIDIFLNFPLMDMNRNVLWHNPDAVLPEQALRMTAFWGDQSWRELAYTTRRNLFGFEEKTQNQEIAMAFRDRLKEMAGFPCVADPVPMRNSKNAVIYYLFFASHKPVAEHIVTDIFNKYRSRGAV